MYVGWRGLVEGLDPVPGMRILRRIVAHSDQSR